LESLTHSRGRPEEEEEHLSFFKAPKHSVGVMPGSTKLMGGTPSLLPSDPTVTVFVKFTDQKSFEMKALVNVVLSRTCCSSKYQRRTQGLHTVEEVLNAKYPLQ
jgi:hypothetical protein